MSPAFQMVSPKYFLLFVLALSCMHVSALSQVYLTKDDALKQYFPSASSIDRKTIFLTEKQAEAIRSRAKARIESRIVTYYVARSGNGVDGYAFFETHVVRTMPETFVVVLSPGGAVRAVEILAFHEPEDYLPPRRWLTLFQGKTIKSDLWLKRGIQNIVGATLSAQGITEGVRTVLSIFELAVQKDHNDREEK